MKVAISVPDPIFRRAEVLASALKKSRSQLYAEALKGYVDAHSANDVTERLNAVYARQPSELDPALSSAQFNALNRETW